LGSHSGGELLVAVYDVDALEFVTSFDVTMDAGLTFSDAQTRTKEPERATYFCCDSFGPNTVELKNTWVKRFIVIDDSKTIREMVRFALEHAGYSIVEAVDGKDGFEKLKSTSDLSMAIVDVNSPI